MFTNKIRVDLQLPRSWNQCSTEQLETIAACILKHTALATKFHPFDWMDVKSELFFLLAEIEIVRIETKEDDPEDVVYVCRHLEKKKKLKSHYVMFNLRSWQVQYWIDTQLQWMDDEKNTLLFFPYKQLLFIRKWKWKWPFAKKVSLAPAELLQNFNWQQYRHLQDYMSMYIDQQNTLVKLMRYQKYEEKAAETQKALFDTRNEFLKVLFGSNTSEKDNADVEKKVKHITEVQWQVILLWWSGMMQYLMQHYPRCFKTTTTKKKTKNPPNPFDLYTSIITTIQDKSHIDEDKINNQTYTIVLEHLERIAKENEEIEKINRKH